MGLADDIHACTRCPLAALQDKGTHHVPASVGDRYVRGNGIAILAEAPGYHEAKKGTPLVGKSGMLFDQLLTRAGLSRDTLVITNSVRCRPVNNNLGNHPEALFACGDWTVAEFLLYDPSIIVVMGATAIKQVYGAAVKVGTIRGTFASLPVAHPWGSRVTLATYHPSAAIYNGGAASEVAEHIVNDLIAAREMLTTLSRRPSVSARRPMPVARSQ